MLIVHFGSLTHKKDKLPKVRRRLDCLTRTTFRFTGVRPSALRPLLSKSLPFSRLSFFYYDYRPVAANPLGPTAGFCEFFFRIDNGLNIAEILRHVNRPSQLESARMSTLGRSAYPLPGSRFFAG